VFGGELPEMDICRRSMALNMATTTSFYVETRIFRFQGIRKTQSGRTPTFIACNTQYEQFVYELGLFLVTAVALGGCRGGEVHDSGLKIWKLALKIFN
jgi:hypothetical protein